MTTKHTNDTKTFREKKEDNEGKGDVTEGTDRTDGPYEAISYLPFLRSWSSFWIQSYAMYFADLTPCSYAGLRESNGVSIGWLDKAHSFPRGAVPDGFIEGLAGICNRPAVQHRGFHVCEFCEAGASSSGVIRVVGRDGKVYFSPAMICHYVAKHGYQPPEDFIKAVIATFAL